MLRFLLTAREDLLCPNPGCPESGNGLLTFLPAAHALVCADDETGAPNGVKTGGNADLLNRR
jgi:hypothetical protein